MQPASSGNINPGFRGQLENFDAASIIARMETMIELKMRVIVSSSEIKFPYKGQDKNIKILNEYFSDVNLVV